jgi:hypothetical protein
MKQLQMAQLSNLVAKSEPCISVYAALSGTWARDFELLQVQIEGALTKARESFPIAEGHFQSIDVMAIMKAVGLTPARKSIAVFKSPTFEGFVTIEEKLDPACVVADSFHLKPLLTKIQVDFRYFAIWLDERKVSLFEGCADTLEKVHEFTNEQATAEKSSEIDRRACPKTLEDLSCQSLRTTIRQRLDRLNEERAIARFFRRCDVQIRSKFLTRGIPVVLIGRQRLTEIFKSVNRHRTPFVASIAKSGPTGPSFGSVHNLIQSMLEDMHRKKGEASLFEFRSEVRSGRTLESLHEIAEAAAKGRIKSLFLRSSSTLWGRLNRKTGKVIVDHSLKGAGDDLLDDIAEQVLKNKGRVYTLSPHEMPTNEPAAAVLLSG